MAVGDLTASTPTYVDAHDPVAIKTAIDALNKAAATDDLICEPVNNGQQFCIFVVERAAS